MTERQETPNTDEMGTEGSDGRRRFLKGALLAGAGDVAGPHLVGSAYAQAQPGAQERKTHYFIPATDKTVHWGYFSRSLKPLVEIDSGDFVTIEALTHHAYDDYDRMIKGDPGAESVHLWLADRHLPACAPQARNAGGNGLGRPAIPAARNPRRVGRARFQLS